MPASDCSVIVSNSGGTQTLDTRPIDIHCEFHIKAKRRGNMSGEQCRTFNVEDIVVYRIVFIP